MGKQQKVKGANGERELAKILATIFDASFIRSDNSGAFVGGRNAYRKDTISQNQNRARRADIIPPDHLPRLVIEVKSYQKFGFHALIQPGPYSLLDDWIKQTISAIDPGDQWFICFKIRFIGWYVALPQSECKGYRFGNYCVYTGAHGAMRVTDLMTFFQTNRNMVLQKAGPP